MNGDIDHELEKGLFGGRRFYGDNTCGMKGEERFKGDERNWCGGDKETGVGWGWGERIKKNKQYMETSYKIISATLIKKFKTQTNRALSLAITHNKPVTQFLQLSFTSQ